MTKTGSTAVNGAVKRHGEAMRLLDERFDEIDAKKNARALVRLVRAERVEEVDE